MEAYETLNHPRNRKLIKDNEGTIIKFRHLPTVCKDALIHYMSIDGAAWAVEDEWPDWRWGEGCPAVDSELRDESLQDIEKFRSRFINDYGNIEFGFVQVPLDQLIKSVAFDEDIDAESFIKDIYITSDLAKSGWEYEKPTWPCIFSNYKHETFQDGWTRFYRYAELKVQNVPCVWFVDQTVTPIN